MNYKEKYREFVKDKEIPIFLEEWYMDAVSGEGEWSIVSVEHGSEVLAVMPFYYKKNITGKVIFMPLLAKYVAPIYSTNVLEKDYDQLFKQLLKKLPKSSFYALSTYYNTGAHCGNWKGDQGERYSYRISRQNIDSLYSSLFRTYRNRIIPRAEENISIRKDLSGDLFQEIHRMTFTRKDQDYPLEDYDLESFIELVKEKNRGEAFFALDRNENIHSVVLLVWDSYSSYSLVIGNDSAKSNKSGAGIFLLWHVIKYSFEILNVPHFDFLGSMIPSIEKVRTNFNGERVYYRHYIRAKSILYKLRMWSRNR